MYLVFVLRSVWKRMYKWQGELPPVVVSVVGGAVGTVVGELLIVVDYVCTMLWKLMVNSRELMF